MTSTRTMTKPSKTTYPKEILDALAECDAIQPPRAFMSIRAYMIRPRRNWIRCAKTTDSILSASKSISVGLNLLKGTKLERLKLLLAPVSPFHLSGEDGEAFCAKVASAFVRS